MWHEARKQEKKLREAMVDYRKRAERRRIHYDKMVGGIIYHAIAITHTLTPAHNACIPQVRTHSCLP